MKSKFILTFALIVLFSFVGGIQSAISSDCVTYCDPKSPGYWKNHPEEIPPWGIGPYSKEEILDWLNRPVKGDKRVTFFKAYIAAKLNVWVNGCYPPHCLLIAHYWWLHNKDTEIKASSEAWQCLGEYLYLCLDDYNNGDWWWCGLDT
jgi:hypothetical protein